MAEGLQRELFVVLDPGVGDGLGGGSAGHQGGG